MHAPLAFCSASFVELIGALSMQIYWVYWKRGKQRFYIRQTVEEDSGLWGGSRLFPFSSVILIHVFRKQRIPFCRNQRPPHSRTFCGVQLHLGGCLWTRHRPIEAKESSRFGTVLLRSCRRVQGLEGHALCVFLPFLVISKIQMMFALVYS